MNADQPVTLGLVVGNRGFFPDHLAKSGREEMIRILEGAGVRVIAPGAEETKYGAVETRAESRICADLFKRHRDEIDGVVVTLPNFGEERGIADALRMADLNVPVLIQATPDTPSRMQIQDRRDSFCGKMSACNNLKQYGIRYSLTTLHTEAPESDVFRKDLEWFKGVCRVVKGLRRLRIGAIGARPAAFNTVRFSEKLLEASGISVEPIDLSEIIGRINRLDDQAEAVQAKLAAINAVRHDGRRPGARADEDGQARCGHRRLDEGHRLRHQRRAVLDLARGVLRRRAVHGHEHDEQRAHVERLRGGYLRRHRDARDAPRLGHAERTARLEQQLR